ncbi:MAG: exo-alpha-sialidase [Acidobacteria bacterium]|nr:exo-alpha-sialidase [Acidobacteriota bacterium]
MYRRIVMLRIWNVIVCLACAVNAISQSDNARRTIRVGPNIQVSKDRANVPHTEVVLAADPADSQRLLAASMLRYEGSEDQCIVYLSTDGGASWKTVLEPGVRAEIRGVKRAADPAVSFGPKGTAYFVMLAAESRLQYHYAVVFRSADSGLTWSEPTHVHQPTRIDRPYITVDQTGGKYHGQVYCNAVVLTDPLPGTGGTSADGLPQGGLGIFFSSDGGRSFSEPVLQRVRMANQPHAPRATGNSVVLSDGTVVMLYNFVENPLRREDRTYWLGVERSVDGGRSLEPASPSQGERPPRGRAIPQSKFIGKTQYGVGLECLAVDSSSGPRRDWLYAVWAEHDGTRNRVMISISTDKGLTWSTPTLVSDSAEAGAAGNYRGAFMPEVAVNKDGVVGVSWYDTRDAAGPDAGWDVRFTASSDGGKTWEPSVRVSETSSIFTTAMQTTFGRRIGPGDTAGLAASADGAFYPLWIDHRTQTPQVWTARITLGQSLR